MNIKCFLFDIGHVLVDLRGAEAIRKFANYDLPISRIKETWLTIESVCAFETGKCDATMFAEGVIDFYNLNVDNEEFISGFELAVIGKFDGVDTMLKRLNKSYSISCITNTNPIQWPVIREILNTDMVFDESIVSYEFGAMKPNLEIYKEAITRTGFQPEEILFIDDNKANIESGLKCGLVCEQVQTFSDVERIAAKYAG